MALFGTLAGCADPKEEVGRSSDDILAADLWVQLKGADRWVTPEGWEGLPASPIESEGAHGAYTWLQANEQAAASLGGDIFDGGILATIDFDEDRETVLQWTAMKKIPGYDPDNDDWFWARYAPGGEVRVAGSLQDCTYCHLNGTDGVWSAWLTPSGDTGL